MLVFNVTKKKKERKAFCEFIDFARKFAKDIEGKSAERDKLMEMDCYSEYKHHIHPNHQHYGTNAATNHPYYAGNYGPTSMRYAHAHSTYSEGGQQSNYFDGYSRYNQLHHHHHHHANYGFNGHYNAVRGENYHAGSETSQYYYQNAHHQTTTAGYYGNHSFESYRNATSSSSSSSTASSGYQYNHYPGGYHQTGPHPSQYYSSYNNSPTISEQFNNRYYPTPPPSAPPTASQRDPYSLVHPESSPYAPPMDESSEKLNNERLSIDGGDKRTVNDPIASSPSTPTAKQQSSENEESVDDETKPDVQQMEMEKSSPRGSNEGVDEKPNTNDDAKADENLDSEEKVEESKSNKHLQSTSLFNEHADHNQHHPGGESLAAKASPQETTTVSEAENSIATGKCEDEKRKSKFS